jgi:hypothetical protein
MTKATLRVIGTVGFAMIALGYLLEGKTSDLVLIFLGAGLTFFSAFYEISLARNEGEDYRLIPKGVVRRP